MKNLWNKFNNEQKKFIVTKRIIIRYGREHGYPHLKFTTLPRFGAVKTILEEIGPRDNDSSQDENRLKNRSKLKLIKDTVGAIREKKYIKGFHIFNFF